MYKNFLSTSDFRSVEHFWQYSLGSLKISSCVTIQATQDMGSGRMKSHMSCVDRSIAELLKFGAMIGCHFERSREVF